MMGKLAKTLMICVVGIGLSACHQQSDQAKKSKASDAIVTAKEKKTVTRLYYKGNLSPRRSVSVLSPDDGRITDVYFKYGESVKKGQTLVKISPTALSKDYRDAVSSYLQKKSSYEAAVKSYQGDKALYSAGVISEQDYTNGKNSYQTSVLDYYQSRYQLEKILKKAGVKAATIEALKFSQPSKINALLSRHFGETPVVAPSNGVVLFPLPDQAKDKDSGDGKLNVGDEVKEEQLLVSVGDLSGYRIPFQVSEVNIGRMKEGLKAKITGSAFPQTELKGKVIAVASQANPNQSDSGSVSMFNVVVEVPHVSAQQQKLIRVGMSAEVEIDISNPPQILVPIGAVFQKNGQSTVTIIDAKTKKHKDVAVSTGKTTVSDVVILKGIKAGDKVLVHD